MSLAPFLPSPFSPLRELNPGQRRVPAAGYERQFAVIDGAVGIAELARRPPLEIMGDFELTAA